MFDFSFSELKIKVIGPRLDAKPSSSADMIDGDNDGKCQEENGKWVPCPPGVGEGSVLQSIDGESVADLDKGGGIDAIKQIHPKFREAMKRRMEKLGISSRELRAESRKALKRATPELIESAKVWYHNVNKKTKEMTKNINDKYNTDISFEQSAAIIAGLSPAREFQKNVRDAKKLMLVHAADEPFQISDDLIEKYKGSKERLDEILKRLGNSPKPSDFKKDELDLLVGLHPVLSKLGNTTGLVNVIRAYSVFRGVNVQDAMSGPKMRSFYSNIVNPDGDRATIDTWMYRVMNSRKSIFTVGKKTGTIAELEKMGVKTQDIFQGTPGDIKDTGIPQNVGLYPEFAEAIRDVAKENGLTPAALQAILWEIARTDAGYKPTQWQKIEKEFNIE
jgi:hypothetical protein